MDNYQSEILRFFRLSKHLPQKAVANFLKISQPYYSELERGEEKLSLQAAELLAEYYGVIKEVFTNEKKEINGQNMDEHHRKKSNPELTNENSKEVIKVLLEKIDTLFNLLEAEKEALSSERKQLLQVFNKLADKMDR